jgi:hypothetical protein
MTRLRLASVLGAAALLVVTAAPARAEVGSFRDARRDTAHPADIVRVVVVHGRETVTVGIHHRNLRWEPENAPRQVRVAFDVGGPTSGPDYHVREPYQADPVVQLRHAQGWVHFQVRPVAGCTGERITVSGRGDRTRVMVPRSCLGDPDRLRVNVLVKTWPAQHESNDVAPAHRRLGPWVAQRPGTS